MLFGRIAAMILKFPEGSIGDVLLVRPKQGKLDWVAFAEASGTVELPDGEEIQLQISANAQFDPSILSFIPPDALSILGWVSTSKVTDSALEHIGRLKGLKVLELWETSIGDKGIAHLEGLVNLVCLDIGDTAITDEGLRHLQALRSLRQLTLLGTRVSENGLRYLRTLDRLEHLDLMKTQVGDGAALELGSMPGLKSVRVYQTGMTEAGYLTLRQAMPACEIRFHHPHRPDPR
jgi:hypothetical protein